MPHVNIIKPGDGWEDTPHRLRVLAVLYAKQSEGKDIKFKALQFATHLTRHQLKNALLELIAEGGLVSYNDETNTWRLTSAGTSAFLSTPGLTVERDGHAVTNPPSVPPPPISPAPLWKDGHATPRLEQLLSEE